MKVWGWVNDQCPVAAILYCIGGEDKYKYHESDKDLTSVIGVTDGKQKAS